MNWASGLNQMPSELLVQTNNKDSEMLLGMTSLHTCRWKSPYTEGSTLLKVLSDLAILLAVAKRRL